MANLGTRRKTILAARATRGAARHPRAARRGGHAAWTAAKPLARRRMRHRRDEVARTSRSVAQTLLAAGREANEISAQLQSPRAKRTAPRVAAGVVLGAALMYYLEPGNGAERRQAVRRQAPGAGAE